MIDAILQIPSDQFIELLKNSGTVVAVLAPIFKLLAGSGKYDTNQLDERYKRFKAFFENGGVAQHPILMESAFGAAIGHTKLDAKEIPLVLLQKKPTAFINTYLRVRSYLAPNELGTEFELKSIAANPLVRKAFVWGGVSLYVLFLGAASWMLLYLAPQLANKHNWSELFWSLVLAGMFAAFAIYCLVEASRPHWARELYTKQIRIT